MGSDSVVHRSYIFYSKGDVGESTTVDRFCTRLNVIILKDLQCRSAFIQLKMNPLDVGVLPVG